MGIFIGHISPGVMFLAVGLYWTFRFWLSYIKVLRYGGSYKSTLNYPFTRKPHIPLDAYFKLGLSVLGFVDEVIVISYASANGICCEGFWTWKGLFMETPQHLCMYALFIMSALVDIAIHRGFRLPPGFQHFTFSLGLAGFSLLLFSHGDEFSLMENQFHKMLFKLGATLSVTIAAEGMYRTQPILPFFRALLTTMTGTWFTQTAFSIYMPLHNEPWDQDDPMTAQVVIVFFIIHIILNMIISLLIYLLLLRWCKVKGVEKASTVRVDDKEERKTLLD